MITKEEAMSIVQRWLDAQHFNEPVVVARVDERPWGWMFSYQTQRFLETRDVGGRLLGNYPVFVTKDDGVLHEVTFNAFRAEEILRLFELSLRNKR